MNRVLFAFLLASVVATPVAVRGQEGPLVEGTVVDSTGVLATGQDAPRPLAGARVWARGVRGHAMTDEGGGFQLELPGSGSHELTFHHPRLDTIGIDEMGWTQLSVPEAGLRWVELAAPSWNTLYALWCGREPGGGEAEGIVAGWVRSALDGEPLPGIAAELRPTDGGERDLASTARSDDDGLFLFCAVRSGVGYRLTVEAFGLDTADEEIRIQAGEIREEEFAFEVGGQGLLRGLVRQGEEGEPVARALVELQGPATRRRSR